LYEKAQIRGEKRTKIEVKQQIKNTAEPQKMERSKGNSTRKSNKKRKKPTRKNAKEEEAACHLAASLHLSSPT